MTTVWVLLSEAIDDPSTVIAVYETEEQAKSSLLLMWGNISRNEWETDYEGSVLYKTPDHFEWYRVVPVPFWGANTP